MSADVTPLVEAFPDNDKYYVVWAFGNLKKNSSDKSTSPLVEVMLREMDSIYLRNPDLGGYGGYGEFGKNEKYGMGKTTVCLISIEELDIVSLGSKWQYKSKLGDKYDFVEYETIPLRFDLSTCEIDSIEYLSRRPNSNKTYIPYKKFTLHGLDDYKHFAKSKLTRLITYRGNEVLIPSLELFSSLFTPFEKEIRRKLLTKSFEDVLDDYVNIDDTYEKDGCYYISMKERKEESNVIFLAYLALNKTTRNKVSKLWASIMAGEGDYFPSVEPYHPKMLDIKAEGTWLNDEKSSFLVFKITQVSLPKEIPIVVTFPETPKYKKKPSNRIVKRKNKYLRGEIEKLVISSDFDPSLIYSPVYLNSEVKIIGSPSVTIKNAKPSEDEARDISSGQAESENTLIEPPVNMSSGEITTAQDNKNTARIKVIESDEKYGNILDVVYETLTQLRDNKHSEFTFYNVKTRIKSIECFNEIGNKFVEEGYGMFPSRIIAMRKVGAWSIIKINRQPKCIRKFLLTKITLENNKSAFLIEVQRSPIERFSGLFFQVKDNALSKSNIEELLIAIATNKGRLTYHTEEDNKVVAEIRHLHFIKATSTFSHQGIMDEKKSQIRMSGLIQGVITEGVFQ